MGRLSKILEWVAKVEFSSSEIVSFSGYMHARIFGKVRIAEFVF